MKIEEITGMIGLDEKDFGKTSLMGETTFEVKMQVPEGALRLPLASGEHQGHAVVSEDGRELTVKVGGRRCRECLHWQEPDGDGPEPDRGRCERFVGGHLRPMAVARISAPRAAHSDLYTAPDFGCVLFEAKGES